MMMSKNRCSLCSAQIAKSALVTQYTCPFFETRYQNSRLLENRTRNRRTQINGKKEKRNRKASGRYRCHSYVPFSPHLRLVKEDFPVHEETYSRTRIDRISDGVIQGSDGTEPFDRVVVKQRKLVEERDEIIQTSGTDQRFKDS